MQHQLSRARWRDEGVRVRRVAWLSLLGAVALPVGCGGGGAMNDAGVTLCSAAEPCSDGLFCNGEERCSPDAAGVDARGCTSGAAPCNSEQTCDEDTDSCGAACPTPDDDGDGVLSVACGGADCDDDDPLRFPGNTERCDDTDTVDHDEDCDGATLGLDVDMDGYASDACSNPEYGTAGTDCEDDDDDIHPDALDVCGGGDQDCDESVDEDPPETSLWYFDGDGDLYGSGDPVASCAAPGNGYVITPGDCNDDLFADSQAAQVNPGESEACNGRDDDCDPDTTEAGCECVFGVDPPLPCGLLDPAQDGVGICHFGTSACSSDGTRAACVNFQNPLPEVCDGADNDCDGDVDAADSTLSGATTCYRDTDSDQWGDSSTARVTCGSCMANEVQQPGDCGPTDSTVHPGAAEVCDGRWNNCNDGVGLRVAEDRDGDGHAAVNTTLCSGGFPANDCQDRTPQAFTGQTGFFGFLRCEAPREVSACGSAPPPYLCFLPSSTPTPCASNPGIPATSGDFDCDGVEQRFPTSGCQPCPVGAGLTNLGPCGCRAELTSPVPACGAAATYRLCQLPCTNPPCAFCSNAGSARQGVMACH